MTNFISIDFQQAVKADYCGINEADRIYQIFADGKEEEWEKCEKHVQGERVSEGSLR